MWHFLKNLFQPRTANGPFADWPDQVSCLPAFDLIEGSLGPLSLGSPMRDAMALGNPDELAPIGEEAHELLYAKLGLMLQYSTGRLAYGAFFLGPDLFNPDHPKLQFAQPPCPALGHLHPKLSLDAVIHALGPAHSDTTDEDERITEFVLPKVIHELEWSLQGDLKRWAWMTPKARSW